MVPGASDTTAALAAFDGAAAGAFACNLGFTGEFSIYRSLISLSVLLTLITVILSAYIRLAEVGIGCEPWPVCYAQLDAGLEKKGVTVLTPQGQDMAHRGARIAHRYIASILGILIVGIFVAALRRGARRTVGIAVPTAVLLITVFLSLLGYYTPTRSNPLITMGNLLGGMAMLGLLWWMMQREAEQIEANAADGRWRVWARLGVAMIALQIVLGGWSSANYASANCPGLIDCQPQLRIADIPDAFNPARAIELDASGKVIRSEAPGLMSMAHRLLALLTAAYLAWLVRALKSQRELGATLATLAVFSIGQLLLGVLNIWFALPLLMLTLHNALAAGLLLSGINLLHRLSPAIGSVPPPSPPPHHPG
ncbi:MAG: COX15/CtaA family protein [Halioglobus sp.]